MWHDIDIRVDRETLACWHYRSETDDLLGPHGRPCVVMAHGLGGLRDSVLTTYAERFAAAGTDVMLFDYRGFGASSGRRRRDDVHPLRQRRDYRAVVAHARTVGGLDGRRVALWGTSLSGGHVVAVAADDPHIAAVIAQGATLDGLAASLARRRADGTRVVLRLARLGLLDLVGLTRWVPVVAERGTPGAFTAHDAVEGFHRVAGQTAPNRMRARGLLRLPANRPVRMASKVTAPMLLVAAQRDAIAPVAELEKAAARVAGDVRLLRYDARHRDLFHGPCFEEVVTAQVSFLREVLAP